MADASMKGRGKIRVAVLYGGRSGEHEISLQSAASVIRNLDPEKYQVIPIGIDKNGKWRLNDLSLLTESGKSLPVFLDAPEVVLPPNPTPPGQANFSLLNPAQAEPRVNSLASGSIDVVFPVMHGPLCEDGSVQGLLELADVAYVGCGVLSSAVGMDKDVSKRLAKEAGLPIVPFVRVRAPEWSNSRERILSQIEEELGSTVFVKPANMGSSVGVHKAKDRESLIQSLNDAFRYDSKVIVETAIQAREIEFAVLENAKAGEDPLVSVAGEIAPTHEFYSYKAKYLDENGAALMIPAELSEEQKTAARNLAQSVFTALECEGMARVDLFLDKSTGEFYFNEVNTIPGFTSISMYPKLWEATGIPYRELLSRLIDLAIARQKSRRALTREYLEE